MEGRTFIKNSTVATGGLGALPTSFQRLNINRFDSKRPPLKKRTFVSDAVESFIERVLESYKRFICI